MAGSANVEIDLESADQYLQRTEDGPLGLEPVDAYMRRVKADIKRSKARAANIVAYILVTGLVLSLPLYVFAAMGQNSVEPAHLITVFTKWYDVVAPLLGAVVGALFGISIATRQRDEGD